MHFLLFTEISKHSSELCITNKYIKHEKYKITIKGVLNKKDV
jgi:hypothetical protein